MKNLKTDNGKKILFLWKHGMYGDAEIREDRHFIKMQIAFEGPTTETTEFLGDLEYLLREYVGDEL